MHLPRTPAWLPIAATMGLAATVLSWLLLILSGDLRGVGTSQIEHYEDASGRLTLPEVVALPEGTWSQLPGRPLLAAKRGGVLWLRVTLRNPTARPQDGVLADAYCFSDQLDLWWREDGRWATARSGEAVPATEKPIVGRDAAFPVVLPPKSERVFWLRATDHFRPFSTLDWWPDQRDYDLARTRSLLAEGIYFGGLLALLGYNTLLWLRLRLTDIGYYVLYLGSVATFILLARGLQGWFGWSIPSPVLETVLVGAMAWSGVFLVQFARAFLDLEALSPRLGLASRCLRMMALALAAGGLVVPLLTQNQWLNTTASGIGVTQLGLLAMATWAWRRGSRQASYFLLAFACFFASSGVLVIAHLWNLAFKDASMRAVMIGSALEMLLLSLAVADRFAQAQLDKAAVQARLLEETEQRRAVEEAYADELEVEVRERTRDLQEADADKDRMLAVIGHDLRSPLVALTQRAEQARSGSHATTAAAVSGQMRDFASQVSAAGRQMLLLIEDIVVWARMRTGTQPGAAVHAVSLLVGPVVTLHRPAAERRAVALEFTAPDDLTVRTDFVLAQTLARNLVGNAVKFARSRVDVTARATPGGVEIVVCDDGPGLPPTVLARLRGEDVSDGDHVGLGLRLSQEIAAQLGVQLTASTRTGESGTEMSVTLPNGRSEGVA